MRGVSCVFILAVLCTSQLALADGTDPLSQPTQVEGAEHLRKGRAAFQLGRFDEAIKEFEAGVEISTGLACWYWNLGQAHRLAGHAKEASWAYERFLALAGDRPEAADRVQLARGFVVDAKRSLADSQRPPTDLDNAAPTGVTEPEPAPAPLVAPAPVRPRRVRTIKPRWYDDTLGWSLAAGAVAFAGVGVGLEISAATARDNAGDAATQHTYQRWIDTAERRANTGALVLVGAGVLSAAAVVRLVLVPEAIHVEASPSYVGLRASF